MHTSTFHNDAQDMAWVHKTLLGCITQYKSALVHYNDNVPEAVYLYLEQDPPMTATEAPDEVWLADPVTHLMVKREPPAHH